MMEFPVKVSNIREYDDGATVECRVVIVDKKTEAVLSSDCSFSFNVKIPVAQQLAVGKKYRLTLEEI
jgi:hypothetical protein